MTEVITYETLKEIQRNEKNGERLVKLEDGFYAGVNAYLNRDAPDEFTQTELKNARIIFEDIIERRERKILNCALRAVRADENPELNGMTSIEKELFEVLLKVLSSHRKKLQEGENITDVVEETAGELKVEEDRFEEVVEQAKEVENQPEPPLPVPEPPKVEENGQNPEIEIPVSEISMVDEKPLVEEPVAETQMVEQPEPESKPIVNQASMQLKPEAAQLIAEKPPEPQPGPEPQPDAPEPAEEIQQEPVGKGYIKVKILDDVPEIVGSNLETYGPFKTGDVTEMPEENARAFISNGKAEELAY